MPEPKPPHLYDLLQDRRSAILQRWEQAIRALASARDLPEAALQDHVPELLSRIAEIGAAVHTGEAALGPLPGLHALDRLDRGFELQEVVTELSMLRRCVLDLMEEESGPTLTLEEIRRLDLIFDEAIATSVSHYATARDRLLRALDRISEAALGSSSLDVFLPRLLRIALEHMEGVDTVEVFLLEGEQLQVRAAVGLEEEVTRGFSLRVGEGFAGRIAAERRPLLLREAATDPLIKSELLRAQGLRVLYGVPLLHQGELIGVAHMGSRSASDFSEKEQLLFRAMTKRITAFLVQARQVAREQTLREKAERLYQEA
jgi:hypothetical protein